MAGNLRNKTYHIVDIEAVVTDLNLSPNANNMCTTYSSKDSQLRSLFSYSKHNEKKNYVDKGNWSIVSMHAARSRVTQRSLPIFRSLERPTKRRELYLKLEEKNQAFKEEKSRYETRLKEEQKVDIKKTRKNLVIKEKPVLSFFYDKRMSQYQADEAPYQDENSGSSSFEVEETD
ncbi:protein WVD2-like 1-like, partial [Trifolium pratense]